MNVKTMQQYQETSTQPEILFWVGCAGSFDSRAQKVTKSFCQLLELAEVEYAILGNEESCTGDPARRAGNEFVFQMLALQNIETLNMYGVQKIVTTCPHCFNTIKNEYPALGGQYEVLHHTQFLQYLIESGRLEIDPAVAASDKITYHDSCYLGRVNGEYDAPRDIVARLGGEIKEMTRNRSRGLCCGAGGAQMFKEDEPGDKSINVERAEEAITTDANIIAVNCPFCMTMMTDGLKAVGAEERVMVLDISELILNAKAPV